MPCSGRSGPGWMSSRTGTAAAPPGTPPSTPSRRPPCPPATSRWPRAHGPARSPVDVIAPCAGCYRAMLKTERTFADGGAVAARVGGALDAAGLRDEGRARVRHPLDVLVNDIGLDRIADAAVRPLRGLRVACYYGCLLVRPYATFDDRRTPTSMERLLESVGAEPIDWPLRTRCCGGSCYCGGPLIGALPEATLRLSHRLLKDAKRRGADAIATVCPLCAVQPRAFQDQMARKFGEPSTSRSVLHAIAGDRARARRAGARRPADAAAGSCRSRWDAVEVPMSQA